LQVVD